MPLRRREVLRVPPAAGQGGSRGGGGGGRQEGRGARETGLELPAAAG